MPREVFGSNHKFMARSALLSFEEIVRVARAAVGVGVRKLRLTGGEPLLRRDIETLVEQLAGIDGVDDLSMTTNGSLLDASRARALRDAGLHRITMSLDALDDATFKRMNDVGFPVSKVLDAVEHAEAAGLGPIKVNMVVKRGVNEHGVLAMAEYFRGTPHIVRFIEFMDVGNSNGWRMDDVYSADEIRRAIDASHPLEPADPNYGGEVAQRWRYRDGAGEVGIISSVTQPFCSGCTRARLSAEGKLYTCLFASGGTDIRERLRNGATDADLATLFESTWRARDDRYSELRTEATGRPPQVDVALPKIEMSYIGG